MMNVIASSIAKPRNTTPATAFACGANNLPIYTLSYPITGLTVNLGKMMTLTPSTPSWPHALNAIASSKFAPNSLVAAAKFGETPDCGNSPGSPLIEMTLVACILVDNSH